MSHRAQFQNARTRIDKKCLSIVKTNAFYHDRGTVFKKHAHSIHICRYGCKDTIRIVCVFENLNQVQLHFHFTLFGLKQIPRRASVCSSACVWACASACVSWDGERERERVRRGVGLAHLCYKGENTWFLKWQFYAGKRAFYEMTKKIVSRRKTRNDPLRVKPVAQGPSERL